MTWTAIPWFQAEYFPWISSVSVSVLMLWASLIVAQQLWVQSASLWCFTKWVTCCLSRQISMHGHVEILWLLLLIFKYILVLQFIKSYCSPWYFSIPGCDRRSIGGYYGNGQHHTEDYTPLLVCSLVALQWEVWRLFLNVGCGPFFLHLQLLNLNGFLTIPPFPSYTIQTIPVCMT